jgi:anti-sigma-K factor RskA
VNAPTPDPPNDESETLAAEFVLGLLDAEGLAQVARLRRRDGRLDAALATWTTQLTPLADDLSPVQPPARLWTAIATATSPVAAPPRRARLWENLAFWRYFGLGSGVFGVAALAAALFAVSFSSPMTPAAVATLTNLSDGSFLATAGRQSGSIWLVVSSAHTNLPSDKTAELWLLLPQQKPRPLGLLASDHAVLMRIAASDDVNPLVSGELAVSLEPPGGSPTGLPTGPLIAKAKFFPLS